MFGDAGAAGRLRAVPMVLLLVAALLLAAAPPSANAQEDGDCPEPLGIAELQQRLDDEETITGTGYTVSRGGTIEPFTVEVLGVQRHFFLPGRHIIVVDTDSPAITQARGIWAGMSGSPVYAEDGRLIGGLAWGFSAGPSKLAGLTPAGELLDLLAYPPDAGAEAVAAQGGSLGPALSVRVAERDPRVGRRMTPLPVPVAIGNPRAVDHAQETFDARGLRARAVPAGGAATATGDLGAADVAVPEAGGNFAAVLARGALQAYGSGTTTLVCEGYAVAFAHFFDAVGATQMGAADGRAITIVDDPLFGPYKMMTLGAPFGTVDQDRFAGIRAALGTSPDGGTVRSTLTDLDTGRTTTELTEVLYHPLFPLFAALHLWDSADATVDRWGAGTSALAWTVTGRRAGGTPWTFTRENLIASGFDITLESIMEMETFLWRLTEQELEEVTLDDVHITGTYEEAVRRSNLRRVEVSVDGGPWEAPQFGLTVAPGAELRLRIVLSGRDPVILTLQVPSDAFGYGSLSVYGGGTPPYFEGMNGIPGEDEVDTFDELLAHLAALPKGNDLVAELRFHDEMPEPPLEPEARASATTVTERVSLDRVVAGELWTELYVEDDGDNGEEPQPEPERTLDRHFGRDRVETAIAIARQTHPEGAETVVLARADVYADALAGAPLAAKHEAPLLLTGGERLHALVAEEIARLGAERVVLLGGEAALSGAVADELAAGELEVTRVAGSDRFDTARRIAGEVGGEQAFLALGTHEDPDRGWPDALAVSAVAAAEQRPILLTTGTALAPAAATALDDLGVTELTVVGGGAAISDAVLAAARTPGRSVDRLAGRTRYETSLAIVRRAAELGAEGGRLWLATGRNFPDALAAGPAVAVDGGVLLLVDGVALAGSPPVSEWLGELGADLEAITLVGGDAAIREDVEAELWAHIEALGGDFPEG
jgi:putative cell wall-binding protein